MKASLPLMALVLILPLAAEEPAKKTGLEPIEGIWVMPGAYYKQVRDVKILNPVTVSFTHSEGNLTVRFDKLEPKWREALGYDQKAAETYEADQAAKEAEKKRLLAEIVATKKKLAEKLAEREKLDEEIAVRKAEKEAAILNKERVINTLALLNI